MRADGVGRLGEGEVREKEKNDEFAQNGAPSAVGGGRDVRSPLSDWWSRRNLGQFRRFTRFGGTGDEAIDVFAQR